MMVLMITVLKLLVMNFMADLISGAIHLVIDVIKHLSGWMMLYVLETKEILLRALIYVNIYLFKL